MPINRSDKKALPATTLGAKPGDFAVGSLESRATARAMLHHSQSITKALISSGLPRMFREEAIIIRPPDTIAYHLASDGSIVEVICREYEPGQFAANIDQTWQDGSVYDGNCWVHSLEDVEKLPATEPPNWVMIERR